MTSPGFHRFPPESERSAGNPGAGQATDPAQRPAPGAGLASGLKRHHAGHPEDPPATDFQDRRRPGRDDGPPATERTPT
ncbi:hypothetical protein GW7_11221 [Heterocephalus glaber]|uniref:Uncharacterized protein n=1 Tax=Heterocephalus glaber TaxID=10181 RepID=G5C122_HETGA|nr:hypothetical protein GW7_11221 [Heterocephalus glaber]